jgi:hypothetical protein
VTALTTEAFRQQVQQTPARSAEVLARLRRQSVHPEEVQADPMALPGGAAGERAWHDRQHVLRRQLKALLAGNQLHAGLVTAALSRPAADGAPETPDGATNDGVTDYVERAGRWIEAVTDALARRWGADPRADAAVEGAALTGYHRYALARTLVAALRDRPELPERVEPERMAAHLAAPAPILPPAPHAPDWVSAGPQTDRALAWSRALAAVLEAAADARPIVEQHALQTSARLYAATLRHVHQESARRIERYQSLRAAGAIEDADELARAYQEGHWGYAGIPHHFRALLATHAAQQDAALAAMAAPAATEQPETRAPGESDRRPGAERTAGPTP